MEHMNFLEPDHHADGADACCVATGGSAAAVTSPPAAQVESVELAVAAVAEHDTAGLELLQAEDCNVAEQPPERRLAEKGSALPGTSSSYEKQ